MLTYDSLITRLQEKLQEEKHLTCHKIIRQFIHLFEQLKTREIPIEALEEPIDRLDKFLEIEPLRFSQLRPLKANIYNILRKQFEILPPNFYKGQWMILGMLIFGIPMGTALGSMAFMGVGIPIGLAIGIAKDKKAQAEGKTLTDI
ncbi:hypothetical protein [Roseivirga sp.]|uniref:hypothetical protein n=1 Tax=Roseivirga sp. TaxID=1964215 RepID=UPI002B26DE89|nr:hypothetical protein [Roseivirga sp.]